MFKYSLCFRRSPVLALLAGWDMVAWDVVFRQSLFVNIITDVVVTWDVTVDVFDWGLVVSGVAAGDQLSHPGLHAYHPPCPLIPCNKSCPRFMSSKLYDKSKTPHFQATFSMFLVLCSICFMCYLYWGHLFHCEVSSCLDFLGWVVARGFVETFGPVWLFATVW